MSAESPRHARSGVGPLTVPSQPPSDRSLIDAVSGFINDVTLSSASSPDPKDTIQWARFESADINEPTSDGDSADVSPLLLTLGYGAGVQVWLIPPNGEAQEVLSWRQGTVRVLRILPTPVLGDSFAPKRPLIALCDSASPGLSFCSLSFISIRGGEQVKSIKFKNPILDVLANKRSVVVSFSERFAVFDAGTLEDRMAVTTCFPCPCPLGGSAPVNPLALGDRWLAYADKKVNPSKRSSGGCEGEGVASYTATVLHAAKSLGKGLRGLGESVAQSLAGGRGASPPHPDMNQPGVLTVIDIEGNTDEEAQDCENVYEPIVAHFVAHSDAIIALQFDASGMLLVTADRRGHDFHVFRVNPHPCGPALASVHHLYVLHRGDTTAKVQDIAISPDSRWVAISTLRGTTHLFPMTPYGGACGVRTHTQPRVVNRLSRFHRSAGLPIAATPPRSGSPVTHLGEGVSQGAWYPNPRLPPYPLPTCVAPLAQLRPTANIPTHTITRNSSGRQRLSSLSESDSNAAPLLARARFGLLATPAVGSPRAPAHLALYLMAANGCLLHLQLHPRSARSVPKEKICDESPIELDVEPIAQWPLQRPPLHAELLAPLPASNPLLLPVSCRRYSDMCVSEEERWLSQVEIVTHAGPHRRLWMGPQFVFKTYTSTGSSSSLSEAETVEVETSVAPGVARSNPVNVPGVRPIVPVLIDSGSASSLEHSPSDSFRRKSLAESRAASVCDVQLREDLAEAMREEQGCGAPRQSPGKDARATVSRAVDQLGTVVVPAPREAPLLDDPDLHTHSNDDEACFRPVVRAPHALPPQPALVVRPLPLDTRIPVQSLAPRQLTPPDEPQPLQSDVVIPAALHNPRDQCSLQDERPAVNLELTLPHKSNLNKDLKLEETKVDECERACERTSVPDVGSLPKSNQPVDIQPALRVKKSPTPKLLSDRKSSNSSKSAKPLERAEVKDKPTPVEAVQTKVVEKDEVKQVKHSKPQNDDFKDIQSSKTDKPLNPADDGDPKETKQVSKPTKEVKQTAEIVKEDVKQYKSNKEVNKLKEEHKEPVNESKKEEAVVAVTLKLPTKVKETTPKRIVETPASKPIEDDIKTEEQAWDLLLNETEKTQVTNIIQQPAIIEKTIEETRVKSKRNRRNRKAQDDATAKVDEDSFIEIHNIEKSQIATGDLVSISSPYEDTEASRQYFSKRKMRSPKSGTPESQSDIGMSDKEDSSTAESSFNILSKERTVSPIRKAISTADYDTQDDIGVLIEPSPELSDKQLFESFDNLQIKHKEGTCSETTSFFASGPSTTKSKKSKSLSPYLDSNRKLAQKQRQENDQKDLIIIDSTAEHFPDIQITKVNKHRKRSPQPTEVKPEAKEPALEKPAIKSWSSIAASEIKEPALGKPATKSWSSIAASETKEPALEKPPIKSWSSIAGSKGGKKTSEVIEKKERSDELKCFFTESVPSKDVSLQDKLFELCKRTDIVVAECDTPTELNFVDEHHTMHDLPPLEPLEFALDDFKMEVMRDSLIEAHDSDVTSPICKINIDDILTSIKETTSKVIESSTFNLVELERVPTTSERGFNVVESDVIVTQEVDIKLEEVRQDEAEIMEKSSDDDNISPVLSTDSDKDDKKAGGAASSNQPLTKQSAKPKKSRRKKK